MGIFSHTGSDMGMVVLDRAKAMLLVRIIWRIAGGKVIGVQIAGSLQPTRNRRSKWLRVFETAGLIIFEVVIWWLKNA
jgi:hypothetical protein